MRDVEGGFLPERGLVRLVHGTRDRVGGRLAPGLRVGLAFNLSRHGAFRSIGQFTIGGGIYSGVKIRNSIHGSVLINIEKVLSYPQSINLLCLSLY